MPPSPLNQYESIEKDTAFTSALESSLEGYYFLQLPVVNLSRTKDW